MLKRLLETTKSEGPYLPNKFTIALGKLVQKARLEANMSQSDLADKAYLKQSSVSRIEVGTRAVSAEEILYLSIALDKPMGYFFPKEFTEEFAETKGIGKDELSELEKEMLIHARQLSPDDLEKLIAQARALAEFRPKKKILK
jgi:transcriptional regulator with XRE-family HTH domain